MFWPYAGLISCLADFIKRELVQFVLPMNVIVFIEITYLCSGPIYRSLPASMLAVLVRHWSFQVGREVENNKQS